MALIQLGREPVPGNPFATHGIKHLSPSSCGLFVAQPAAWVYRYVLGNKGRVGPAAHRGTAVEAGVVHAFEDGAKNGGDFAIAEFDRLTALSGDSRREKERASIVDMVKVATDELAVYGPPTQTQRYVAMQGDGLQVPIIGYADMVWDNHGMVADLKTLHALPSSIRPSHARQVALYHQAINGNYKPLVVYVTSKKSAAYEVEGSAGHLDALSRVAQTIQRFLSVSDDPHKLAALTIPDFDSFYWSDPLDRHEAGKIWGI